MVDWQPGDQERRKESIKTIIWMKELEMRFHQLITDMNRMHDDNVRLLRRHDEALFGNGKPGVVHEVHDIKKLVAGARWVIVVGGGVIVMQVAQFFVELFRRGV